MGRSELARIDADPIVRAAAEQLGIRGTSHLKAAICDRSVEQVHKWIDELNFRPHNLEEVHRIVLSNTRVKIERVESDEDLRRIEAKLKAISLPVQLELEFGEDTEALVVRNDRAEPRSSSRYLAVVDARGARQYRAWFAERHEPGHIVARDPAAKEVSRRTKEYRPQPIEVVVDAVASAVGFWRPVVLPVLRDKLARCDSLLEALEATRQAIAPSASREATCRALVQFLDRPVIVLRSEEGCRSADRERNPANSWALRAQTVIHNEAAARAGMRVWRNFRIPTDSVIASAPDLWPRYLSEDDNLGRWKAESGPSLGRHSVRVTAQGRWSVLESTEL